jgi:hypothetical protein
MATDDARKFTNIVSKLGCRARHADMIAISLGVVNPAAGLAANGSVTPSACLVF